MKQHPLRKGLVALATVFAFLFVSAGPASSAEIVSGTLTIGDPTQWEFDLGGTEDPPCDVGEKGFPGLLPDPYPEFEFHKDTVTKTWWTTGILSGTFLLNNQWYQITFLFDDYPPAFTTGPEGDYVWDPILERKDLTGGGTIWFVIHEINIPDPPDPEEPCDKKEQVCIGFVNVVLVAPSYYEPGPPERLVINAQSVAPHIQTAGCQQPFLGMHGEPAFINNMEVSLP